jgi:hypothetical protein
MEILKYERNVNCQIYHKYKGMASTRESRYFLKKNTSHNPAVKCQTNSSSSTWFAAYLAMEIKDLDNALLFFNQRPCRIGPTQWTIEITAMKLNIATAKYPAVCSSYFCARALAAWLAARVMVVGTFMTNSKM